MEDGFVGALHSVLRQRVPDVPVVDLSHGIARHDVRAGSLALRRLAPYLATGAVVGVVDPGVGPGRRPVVIETVGLGNGPVFFVGPDNGLLPPAAEALGGVSRVVHLQDRGYWLPAPGPTFAGRDIFAPAAAQLALGAAVSDLGADVAPESLVRLAVPLVTRDVDGYLGCEVTWVDRFGNVQLAATGTDLAVAGAAFEVTTRKGAPPVPATVAHTFADLAEGQLGLLVDSEGHLALCLNKGHAAGALAVAEGDVVMLREVVVR